MKKFNSLYKITAGVLFLLSIVIMGVHGQSVHAEPIQFNENMETYAIGRHLEFIEDKEKQLSIEDLKKGEKTWQKYDRDAVNFGFSSSVYWFKFSVIHEQTLNNKLYLEIDYPMIDRITVYTPDKKGQYQKKETGDHFPFNKREVLNRAFLFSLNQQAGTHTYYFQIKTTSSINFTPSILSENAYQKRIIYEYPFFWIYYGIMIAMVIYNIFLLFSIREITYLYYVLFISCYILFQLSLNGFSFQFLWPNHIWWANNNLPVLMCMTVLWGSMFFRSYMNTEKHFPMINRLLIWGAIIPNLFWCILSLSGKYSITIKVATFLTLYTCTVLYLCAVVATFHRSRPGRFIFIGFSFLLIGAVLYALMTLGIIPTNFITKWSIQIGSSIVVISFSLGLADQINRLKNDLMTSNFNIRLTETALRESENMYRLLADNVTDNIWVLDMNTLKPIYTSPSVFQMRGYTPEEAVELSLEDSLPPSSLKRVMKIFSEELEKETKDVVNPSRTRTLEIENYCKDGSTIWIETITKFLRDENGKAVNILGVTRDITERKQAEEALKSAKLEAEAANIAKSTFLANMSHEIRTPMNAIIGMSDLMMRTESREKQEEYLGVIQSSSKSLLRLIDDILDFSKIEAGKLEFKNSPFSLNDVVEDITDMLLENIHEKEIELIVDIAADVPARVVGDPLRLRQILVNLTTNAIKFTENGEISIFIQTQSSSIDSVTLLFCVRDTGIGIDQEKLGESGKGAIFDAFTQVDSSFTRKYGGTGLGLAISKIIVDMMGGEMWVESEKGLGSSFYFTVRLHSMIDDVDADLYVPAHLQNLNVLIIEDNPTTQMVLKKLIESFGFRVEMAKNAETGFELYEKAAKENRFDLILMDVRLPGMSGITAARKIKRETRFSPPPVIIISAFSSESEIHMARDLGVENFLMKPIKRGMLFKTIMKVMGQGKDEPEKTVEKKERTSPFAGIHILVVEDNQVNQMVAYEILTSEGISVHEADNGHNAIEMIRDNRYDAILMDVQMPDIDGIETTKRIREDLGLKDVPVIAMTAHAMTGMKEKCLESGMDDYISKPINREQLLFSLKKQIFNIKELMPHETGTNDFSVTETNTDDNALSVLNINEGLNRLGCGWARYKEILKTFIKTYKSFSDELRSLIADKDFDTANKKAHSLKGAAGNVSASSLKVTAEALEKNCENKDIDRILNLLPEVDNVLNQITLSIGDEE